MRGAARAALAALQAQRRQDGDHQHRAEQVEGVAIAHDQGLPVHDAADRDRRLVPGLAGVGEAMRHEIVAELGKACPRRVGETARPPR